MNVTGDLNMNIIDWIVVPTPKSVHVCVCVHGGVHMHVRTYVPSFSGRR